MADQYVNVNGVWRKADPKFVAVDGVNRQVQNAFVVDNGVIRKCWDNFNPNMGDFYGPKYPTSGYTNCFTTISAQNIYDAVMAGYTKIEFDLGMTCDYVRTYSGNASSKPQIGLRIYDNTSCCFHDRSSVNTTWYDTWTSSWYYGYNSHRSEELVKPSDSDWQYLMRYINRISDYYDPNKMALYGIASNRYYDGTDYKDYGWSNMTGTYWKDGIGPFTLYVKNVKFTK